MVKFSIKLPNLLPQCFTCCLFGCFADLQCDYYNWVHLDKENQTILQNGNEEFQLQLFEPISFQFNTTFQRGINLNFSIPLYNM